MMSKIRTGLVATGVSVVCLCILFSIKGTAVSFEITDVVEVGRIFGGGMYRPAQWSPDGTMLAYFHDGHLLVSDTLGNSRIVTEIELAPHGYEWVSNEEIVLHQRKQDTNLVMWNRLIRIDIGSGEKTVLEEYRHRIGRGGDSEGVVFRGPYKTVEGSAFYYREEGGVEEIELVRPAAADPNEALNKIAPQHILRTGEDAVYMVRTDQKDSVKISNKPYKNYLPIPVNLSPDKTHIMYGGNIVRLADDHLIILDTLEQVKDKPEGTQGCGFGDESFSPVATEVAFNLSCDDGLSYVVDRMGVFDYETYEFTIVDSLISIYNCRWPAYSPDGKRIAFISKGVLYFLVREYDEGDYITAE
jgi:hypothetical protein